MCVTEGGGGSVARYTRDAMHALLLQNPSE